MTQGNTLTPAQAEKQILLMLKRMSFYVNNLDVHKVYLAIKKIADKVAPVIY